ncbi:MAG: ABC transporter permease [Hyphomicrobiaceae bacterium]|nr:ABC transporter permease [Hyphomicrobiaceae bacterium]
MSITQSPAEQTTVERGAVIRHNNRRPALFIARDDFIEALQKRYLWLTLGYIELKRRYRRTILGPFWAAGHIALYVVCVGFIFSSVLATDRATYIPYLATSFVAWMLVYNTLQESSGAFVSASSLRQQIPVPYFHFILLTLWRNILVHIHNYSLILIVSLFYGFKMTWFTTLLLIPGYILVMLNLLWLALLFATLAARYRDVTQLVAAIIQVMVFVTPIFYSPDMLTKFQRIYVLTPNLLYHLTVVLRDPLLGKLPPVSSYYILVFTAIFGNLLAWWLFGKKRNQIIYWIM